MSNNSLSHLRLSTAHVRCRISPVDLVPSLEALRGVARCRALAAQGIPAGRAVGTILKVVRPEGIAASRWCLSHSGDLISQPTSRWAETSIRGHSCPNSRTQFIPKQSNTVHAQTVKDKKSSADLSIAISVWAAVTRKASLATTQYDQAFVKSLLV